MIEGFDSAPEIKEDSLVKIKPGCLPPVGPVLNTKDAYRVIRIDKATDFRPSLYWIAPQDMSEKDKSDFQNLKEGAPYDARFDVTIHMVEKELILLKD